MYPPSFLSWSSANVSASEITPTNTSLLVSNFPNFTSITCAKRACHWSRDSTLPSPASPPRKSKESRASSSSASPAASHHPPQYRTTFAKVASKDSVYSCTVAASLQERVTGTHCGCRGTVGKHISGGSRFVRCDVQRFRTFRNSRRDNRAPKVSETMSRFSASLDPGVALSAHLCRARSCVMSQTPAPVSRAVGRHSKSNSCGSSTTSRDQRIKVGFETTKGSFHKGWYGAVSVSAD